MDSRLLIEPLPEEADTMRTATEAERTAARALPAGQRRREWLAWRAIVRRELGAVEIGYDRNGAPTVAGRNGLHIGVSHCRGWVAVCVSERRCAVDIELRSRNFEKAAPRFLTDAERALGDHPLLSAVVWCAKEALYKYAGEPGLDLRRDLRIETIDFARGCATGRIKNGAPVRLSVSFTDDLVAAYIL